MDEYKKAYDELLDQYSAENAKYKEAWKQLELFDQKFAELEYRHDQAAANESRAARYSWKLQLSTLIYVRNMFYQYAKLKAEHLDIRKQHIIEFPKLEKLPPNEFSSLTTI